ncbi:MAG: hypothetical protein GXO32_06405 [Crenarchaeota archaeon]|nr:hypothetical protein [Thermoproteota archaeon]
MSRNTVVVIVDPQIIEWLRRALGEFIYYKSRRLSENHSKSYKFLKELADVIKFIKKVFGDVIYKTPYYGVMRILDRDTRLQDFEYIAKRRNLDKFFKLIHILGIGPLEYLLTSLIRSDPVVNSSILKVCLGSCKEVFRGVQNSVNCLVCIEDYFKSWHKDTIEAFKYLACIAHCNEYIKKVSKGTKLCMLLVDCCGFRCAENLCHNNNFTIEISSGACDVMDCEGEALFILCCKFLK